MSVDKFVDEMTERLDTGDGVDELVESIFEDADDRPDSKHASAGAFGHGYVRAESRENGPTATEHPEADNITRSDFGTSEDGKTGNILENSEVYQHG